MQSPPATPGTRRALLEIDGPGESHLVARATLDLATAITHWEMEPVDLSLADFYPLLAPRFLPPELSGFDVSGSLTLALAGTLQSDDLSAKAALTLTDVTVRDDVKGWIAEGINAHISLPALPSLRTDTPQTLTLRAFTHTSTGLAMSDLQTAFWIEPGGRIHFSETRVEGLGGKLALGAFDFDPRALDLSVPVHVENIESTHLAAFIPEAISEVHGRFSGDLLLHWTPKDGLKPGDGKLELVRAPGTTLRLSKAPGFFTSNLDERLYFLPTSWGFLRRMISLSNPAYGTLKKIENGEMPIEVERISIHFTPAGDSAGRTATVTIVARPADPKSAIKTLRINVSVNGPLVEVLKFGATDNMNFNW